MMHAPSFRASHPARVSALGGIGTRLLQWTGRLTRDAMLQKSVVSLADQAVVSAMNFGVTVFLTRTTDQAEVGLYYLALQIVFFLRGIQEQLIAAPYLIYSGRKSPEQRSSYAGSTLLHDLLLLLATSIVLGMAALSGLISSNLSDLLVVLVLATPLMLLRELQRQFLFAELRVWSALAFDVAVVLCQIVGLALCYGLLGMTATTAYTALAAGCAVPGMAWFAWQRGAFQLDLRRAWSDWLANWSFARWALATQLLGCSMPFLIPWVVASHHGTAATGVLGVGTTLIGIANMFVLGISNFVCPQAARAYASGGRWPLVTVLLKASTLYLVVLGTFTAAMCLRGPELMALVYGPAFAASGPLVAILACGALANSLGIVAGNGLWAMERPAANFLADVCALVCWVIATLLLVEPLGAWGAAVASTLGVVMSAAVRLAILVRELRHAAP